jgi:hypothetical protein
MEERVGLAIGLGEEVVYLYQCTGLGKPCWGLSG